MLLLRLALLSLFWLLAACLLLPLLPFLRGEDGGHVGLGLVGLVQGKVGDGGFDLGLSRNDLRGRALTVFLARL